VEVVDLSEDDDVVNGEGCGMRTFDGLLRISAANFSLLRRFAGLCGFDAAEEGGVSTVMIFGSVLLSLWPLEKTLAKIWRHSDLAVTGDKLI
jgi:hypothetical protein